MCVSFTTLCMPMAYFDSILVTRLTVDFNRENGGLVFQPFLDFRVEIFTEDGHFLAISVFIIVTGLKPQNKKQFGVRLYRQFWEKFIDMSQKFVDEYRECQYVILKFVFLGCTCFRDVFLKTNTWRTSRPCSSGSRRPLSCWCHRCPTVFCQHQPSPHSSS